MMTPRADHAVVTHDVLATTAEAGQSIDEGSGRIFPCESCGADLKFHIGHQNLTCPHCGFQKQIAVPDDEELREQNFHEMLLRLRELHAQGRRHIEGQHEIRCESCGGQAVFLGSLTSDECPYCGSPIQRDQVHDAEDRVPVDGVLPFRITRQTAQSNLSTWVKSRWFAPNDFLQRGVRGQFNGIYLPYWTFDSMTFTRYSGQRGEHYYKTVGTGKNKRRVRHTRWYPASGRFERFFDDVLVLATRGMKTEFMQELEPWPLGKCAPFNQQMLAGQLARTYEIELDEGFELARERIDAALLAEIRRRIGGDVQRVHQVDTRYNAVTFKHLLLPVWLLAYRYHQRAYQVMVNAATGEVQGERPYSWVKITLTIAAAVAVVGGIVLLTRS